MTELRRVCVFCGSSAGADPAYRISAQRLGTVLADRGIDVVYGGGRVGLMGVVADAALARGGTVIGVIPKGLFSREVAHTGVSELHEVGSMHERKTLMYDLSDAFVALPGGLGTLEELAEVTTWAQLGLHTKPVALLGVAGFWRRLVDLLDGMVIAGFLKPANRALVEHYDDIDTLLAGLAAYEPTFVEKWIEPAER